MSELLAFTLIVIVAILFWAVTTWRWCMRQHTTLMPNWALRWKRWRMRRQVLTAEGDEILNEIEDELKWREDH